MCLVEFRMDMWGWVDAALERLRSDDSMPAQRLADLIEALPGHVTDEEHEHVDGLMPEALALARSLQLPWMEIFLRHWDMQSRVLNRAAGESALGDAVALVELAHRDDSKACPQSVCTVQDLAACYGNVDGPGYAPERIAVATETLDRIDAHWPCFVCVSSEQAAAMVDDDQPEAALLFLGQQERTMRKARVEVEPGDFGRNRVACLLLLKRWQEALDVLDKTDDDDDNGHRVEQGLSRALALSQLGRHDEATQSIPPFAEVEKSPSMYVRYAELAQLRVAAGAWPNEGRLGGVLESFSRKLWQLGSWFLCARVSIIHGELACARGGGVLARAALARATAATAKLRKPQLVSGALEQLSIMVNNTAAIAVSGDRSEIDDEPDLERRALRCEGWLRSHPDNADVAVTLCSCWIELGLVDEARTRLSSLCAQSPLPSAAVAALSALLRRERDGVATELLATQLETRSPIDATWVRGMWHVDSAQRSLDDDQRTSHLRAAATLLQRVADDDVAHINTRRELAMVLRSLRRFDEELEIRQQIVAHAGVAVDDWLLAMVATRLGQWRVVRACAARLGMVVGGDGDTPIDGELGICHLALQQPAFEDGDERDEERTLVLRTGPVTARVFGIAVPGRRQRFGETLLLEPRPLNDPPLDDAGDPVDPYLYPAVAVLQRSDARVFFIDGVAPADHVMEQLVGALRARGVVVARKSGDQYMVPELDVPGLCIGLGLGPEHAVADVYAVVRAHLADAREPLSYAALARAAGDEPRAIGDEAKNERHRLDG
jgi:tetratricopeptide (TPR) repeat protein